VRLTISLFSVKKASKKLSTHGGKNAPYLLHGDSRWDRDARDRGVVMTETSQNSDISGGGLEPMSLPDWMPPAVQSVARWMLPCLSNQHELAILRRLAIDPRMEGVWRELTRRDRNTGEFLHTVRRSDPLLNCTHDQVHQDAMARTFHLAFCAAKDRMAVTKPSDAAPLRDLCEQRARVLRDVADDLDAINSADPHVSAAAATLRQVADWQDDGIKILRSPTDPMMVKNHRGDPVARGVQIIIAAHFEELFGEHLNGTAATLAAVALGHNRTSPRISRSAFSAKKKPPRS
jgi:hypothetical protein